MVVGATHLEFVIDSVASKDGTKIGYRRYGTGPSVVLVQGAMAYARQYSQLAEALAGSFTVYVPDRRGRGMSPKPYTRDHVIERDIEDLDAVLAATGATRVFGLSSGATIGLTTAARFPRIRKLAVFEPPMFVGGLPRGQIGRFERAMAKGDLAAGFAAAGKTMRLVPLLRFIPNWLLASMLGRMFAAEAKHPKPTGVNDYPPMSEIAPSLQYDFRIVPDAHGHADGWRAITADLLILGGEKSPEFLKADLEALRKLLPNAKVVIFPELDHGAPWDRHPQRNPHGDPAAVAKELRVFFA
jgi:pimeloyl-ACP methyl ester carboxylesterase